MIIKTIIMTLIPVLVLVVLRLYEKKNRKFAESKIKIIIAGILFGLVAVYCTEFGVNIGVAVINARDAAVICAGFFYGPFAAMIAAVIGGVERFLAPLWGVGAYTRYACSIATFFAGVFTALMVDKLFEGSRPKWYHAVLSGVVIEIFHMLMVFITHQENLQMAYKVVLACTTPMVLMNTLSVTFAVVAADIIDKKKIEFPNVHDVTSQFGLVLGIVMVMAFFITFTFTYISQKNLCETETTEKLNESIEDIEGQINLVCDQHMSDIIGLVNKEIKRVYDAEGKDLSVYLDRYGIRDICIIDKFGIIKYASDPSFIGYEMDSADQSREFNRLLGHPEEIYIQNFVPMGIDGNEIRKFAGLGLDDGTYMQIGLDYNRMRGIISSKMVDISKYRHIDRTGYVLVANVTGKIVSDSGNFKGKKLKDVGLRGNIAKETLQQGLIKGQDSFYICKTSGDHDIIAVLPVEEAQSSFKIAITMNLYIEIIVFAILFISIYLCIKKLIINNLDYVTKNLNEISDGNLEVRLGIKGTSQFESLSLDINKTVDKLKQLIQEAESRIDAELEFAKQIQCGSLISTFPAFPDINSFDIHAFMRTAKEVGGDFYDFCLVNNSKLYFMIADVSGKGIPAALFMMRGKAIFRDLCEAEMDVDEIYTKGNNLLCENNDAGLFITSWMGCLDINTGKLSYVNAGHNPPVLVRKNKKAEYLRNVSGLVLAAMDCVPYKSYEMELEKGDSILLYTDGITEATSADIELYGEDRLEQFLSDKDFANPKQICLDVIEDTDKFVGKADQFDDMTLLCLQFLGK